MMHCTAGRRSQLFPVRHPNNSTIKHWASLCASLSIPISYDAWGQMRLCMKEWDRGLADPLQVTATVLLMTQQCNQVRSRYTKFTTRGYRTYQLTCCACSGSNSFRGSEPDHEQAPDQDLPSALCRILSQSHPQKIPRGRRI